MAGEEESRENIFVKMENIILLCVYERGSGGYTAVWGGLGQLNNNKKYKVRNG